MHRSVNYLTNRYHIAPNIRNKQFGNFAFPEISVEI